MQTLALQRAYEGTVPFVTEVDARSHQGRMTVLGYPDPIWPIARVYGELCARLGERTDVELSCNNDMQLDAS